jgi:hypothetical protein
VQDLGDVDLWLVRLDGEQRGAEGDRQGGEQRRTSLAAQRVHHRPAG